MFKLCDEPLSPKEGGVFKVYDEPEPPNEGVCVCVCVVYMLNRIVKRGRVFKM